MTDKVVLSPVSSFVNDTTAVSTVNNNMVAITTAMDNTLSRDGTSPNMMNATLDMNSNQIINLPPPSTVNSPARLIDVVGNPTIVIPGTGTSGHVVPFLDGNNTFSGTNTFTQDITFPMSAKTIKGNSTSGTANATDLTGDAVEGLLLFTQTGTGATQRTLDSKIKDTVSILDFGADPTGAVDATTAIQNAVNAVTTGGTVLVPGSGYNMTGTVVINKPVRILGARFVNSSTGNINLTSTVNPMFSVRAHYVTFENLYLNAAGAASTNVAVNVGDDAITITDTAISATASVLTSVSQSNWTTADIGKNVKVAGAGAGGIALFAVITSINSIHSINLSIAASTTVSGATANYGLVYLNTHVLNCNMVNFNRGIHFIDAAQWSVNNTYMLCNTCLLIENQLSFDYGTNMIHSCYLLASDTAVGHRAIEHRSGGDLYITGTKLLNGDYAYYMNWNLGTSGNIMMSGSSAENSSVSSLFFSPVVEFNNVVISGCEFSSGNPSISFDNTSAAIINRATVTGTVFGGGGGTAISVGKVNFGCFTGNTIQTGGGNPAINLLSNSQNCNVSGNLIIGATKTIGNAGTSNLIDDINGMTFANIPTTAQVGSRIFITDGTPGATLAGSGTGSLALRNTASNWKGL